MSRPKIPGNKRSRVLYTRDAFNTLNAILHMWGVENLVSLHTKVNHDKNSLLDVGTGSGFGFYATTNALGNAVLNDFDEDCDLLETIWPTTSKDSPNIGSGPGAVNWSADIDATDNPVLGTYQLITLDKAVAWFSSEFARVMAKYNLKMMNRTVQGKRGRYRAFCHWTRGQIRSGLYLKMGIERLQQVCLTQRRRAKGPQLIQTRRPITAPYYKSFLFNGTHAIRLPQGRPALSKAESLRRYMERLKRHRKTNRPYRGKGNPKIYQPKNGRPSRQIEAKIQTHRPVVQQYESAPMFEPDLEFDWSETGRDFLEKITEEITKGIGEEAGNYVVDKFKEITGLQ